MVSKHLFTYSSEHKYMYNSSYNTTRSAWQKKDHSSSTYLSSIHQDHVIGVKGNTSKEL